jgi:hypothetical protein
LPDLQKNFEWQIAEDYFCLQQIHMRITFLFLLVGAIAFATSCSNSSSGKTFCDTACGTDSFNFKGADPLNPIVAIGVNKCKADSMLWAYDLVDSRLISLSEFLGQPVNLNKSAIDCFFKDTSYAWLQFNDCITGRGFLVKLSYDRAKETRKITGAFTKFDPKFSIDPELVAYTDRGSVFVENMATGQKATLSFEKAYDIEFNKLHETVDSVNITKSRVFVKMVEEGKVYEKKISL